MTHRAARVWDWFRNSGPHPYETRAEEAERAAGPRAAQPPHDINTEERQETDHEHAA